MNLGFNNFWATPFYYSRMENDELIQSLIDNFLSKSNTNNFHESLDFNLFDSEEKFILEFKNDIVYPAFKSYVSEVFKKNLDDYGYQMKAWYNVSSTPSHNHSGSNLSAVFYLMVPSENDGGKITFTDPRINSNRGYPTDFRNIFEPLNYQPILGDFIIFPSFVYHYVHASNTKRLCIPVDLFLNNE
jgi:hypothetical protein